MAKTPIDLQNKLFYHPDKLIEFFKTGNTTPVTWELDPTNRCNHNCIGCYAAGAGGRTNDDSLNWEQAKNYVDQVRDLGAKAINLTGGGDPMVNKITPRLIEYIRSLGMDVGMITNGTIFTDKSIDIVVKIRIISEVHDKETLFADLLSVIHIVKVFNVRSIHSRDSVTHF